jgi:PadR family transcriptional regulator, regulatory protein PadR
VLLWSFLDAQGEAAAVGNRDNQDNQIDLLQGTLDLLILKALSLGPLHGYGVLLRIQQISGKQLEIQQGSLYPALYRVEHQGWIAGEWGESENNRRAKYYKLTAVGRRQLQSETEKWNRMVSLIGSILRTTSLGLGEEI